VEAEPHGVHAFSVAKQTHGVHGLDSSAVCCWL